MSANVVDVVVVPDFAGPARALFEARTRLFLGSWIEHSGASRSWPLHVVAIGDVPAAVASLAERAGARVHAAETLDPEQPYLNKLRGLEIDATGGRILLLDADTVVLGDLSPALGLGDAFAALPAATNRIPSAVWEEVFRAGGVEPPAERVKPLIGEWERELPASVMREPFREAVPLHWNSGVVLSPAGCGLREAWEEAARALAARFEGTDWFRHVCGNDQPSLAVAAARLRARGVRYTPLPFALHGFDLLYATGRLRFEDTAVYHAKTLYRRDKNAQMLDPLREVALYRRNQLPRLYPESRIARALRRLRGRVHPARADSIVKLCERLDALTRSYVV